MALQSMSEPRDGTDLKQGLPDASPHGPTLVPLKARVVGGGDNHSLAIAKNGAVLAWGSNAGGQLGDGTQTTRFHPAEVHGLFASSKVVAVAGGRFFSLALELDGTVLAWGTGGDGTSETRLTPVTIEGLGPDPRVIAIAAGASHALALKSDGTVWAWGNNQNGQLGLGDTAPNPPITNSSNPIKVKGLPAGVQAIAASGTVSAALTSDGTVFTWGNNAFGQLGTGDTIPKRSPFEVKLLGSDVRAIVIGAYSVALKLDGSVFTWGTNSFGTLGDNESPDLARTSPLRVIAPGSGIIAIAGGASGSHVLALKDDRTVLAWGANSAGQLGDNTTVNRFGPTLVPGLTNVVEVAVGGSHSLVRQVDGTVLAWGSNGSGQLGDGTIQASVSFVNVADLGTGAPITSVSACTNHVLARRSDGSVLAWGSNGSGQLGNSNPETQFRPVVVTDLSDVTAVACGVGGGGGGHSLALKEDGTVVAWGANTNGQLGIGNNEQKTAPVLVEFQDTASPVVAIAAGGLSFSLALKQDGSVWAWGTNNNGQLGDNTAPFDKLRPVQVLGSESDPELRVIAIAAGNHGLALRKNGQVLAWGGNSFGQLGNNSKKQRPSPVRILDAGSGVKAIEAAANYSLALKSDGTLLAWGSNASGQLGLGDSTPESLIPVPVPTLAMVTAISIDRSSGSSSFATLADGTVLGFGSNATGQLADGTFDASFDALRVDYPFALDPHVTVRAGTGFLLVLRPDGALFAVGTDAYGQLGDGQNTKKNQTPSPVLVMVTP
jgi:alpha-tubulin suppressor-like RCC1 family protein